MGSWTIEKWLYDQIQFESHKFCALSVWWLGSNFKIYSLPVIGEYKNDMCEYKLMTPFKHIKKNLDTHTYIQNYLFIYKYFVLNK